MPTQQVYRYHLEKLELSHFDGDLYSRTEIFLNWNVTVSMSSLRAYICNHYALDQGQQTLDHGPIARFCI